MKKKLITILCFTFLVSLLVTGCGENSGGDNPWDEKPKLQKETASYKKELAYTDDQVACWIIYEYDEAGNEIYVTEYSEYEGAVISEYQTKEYDDNGNLVLHTAYDYDGKVDSYYEFSYDEAGNEIRFDSHYSVDGWYSSHVKEYDDNGLCTVDQTYIIDGDETKTSYRSEYFYDDNGNLIREDEYDPEGVLVSVCNYSINEDGKPYYMERKSSQDENHVSYHYYTYDHNGNQLFDTVCFNDTTLTSAYEYDTKGRMIKYVRSGSTVEGSTVLKYEYSYHDAK